ncbi:iron-sulfur cluster assembly scaffold protein [Candidatus Peregrinibacteria bacterium]|nr:iron-sulfur cluster assembly scaffold protein [Candidatus Peregrinibacteria bacterium]
MDLYAENILEHYRNPRGKGTIVPTDWHVTHAEQNPSCGDELTIAFTITNGVMTDVTWEGSGCAISQAGMSILAEELVGKTSNDIERMTKNDMYALLGVPVGPRRFKCALLGLHTLKNALRKHAGKTPQSWIDTVELADQ